MTVAYRSSNTVTNGTAGTSVTVSKPAGMTETGAAGADVMVAFIAAVGAPTFTAPAGWTLATTVASGSSVTLNVYWKLASSEAATFTWTLGSSQRNWGVVAAYTGVDPTAPIFTSGTSSTLNASTSLTVNSTIEPGGCYVAGAAAVRAASGAATTWQIVGLTTSPTERADLSTNAGAGTDISGAVADRVVQLTFTVGNTSDTATASQTQTAGVMAEVGLSPYFVPYTGAVAATGLVVEAALGVDPASDSSDWTWTDVTSYVLEGSKVVLRHGRLNRAGVADPSQIQFTVKNLNGEWTNPTGAYAQYLVQNLPFRVRLNGFGTTVSGLGYHRGTAFLAAARPRWDTSTNYSVVDIVAAGRLRQMQANDAPVHSAAYTAIQRMDQNIAAAPVAHWPFEDEVGAAAASSAVVGAQPATAVAVTFAADSTVAGADLLAQLGATSTVVATIPPHAYTGTWTAMFAATLPSEPAAETTLLQIAATGTAATWKVTVAPGTTAVHVRAYDAGGTSLLDDTANVTEASFYGVGRFYTLTVTQSGPDIAYVLWCYHATDSGGKTGTLSGRTIGSPTRFLVPAAAGLAGAGFGHLALHTAVGANGSSAYLAVLTANTGDWIYARFARLCSEYNVPALSDVPENYTDYTMGPQPIGQLVELLRECEDLEGSVLNDSGVYVLGTGLVWLPARDDRENITATMTLDFASGQVAPTFDPILDDQDIVNDATVTRSGGGSGHAQDDVSIDKKGQYSQAATVSKEDDTFLADLAGWRVNLGTAPGMRFPGVRWNLRASPELAEQWMACRLFHRIDVTNPPTQYPPDVIAAILEGYTEEISAADWSVAGNLSPYSPNHIMLLADPSGDVDDFLGRLAGDHACALRTAIDSDDTAIVVDPNRQRWTTRLVWDAYGRTTSSSWGAADSGQTWTNTGTAANFSVSTGSGRHSLPAVNSSRWSTITSTAADVRVVASVATDVLAAGGSQFLAVVARWADVDNNYLARLEFTTAAVVNLTIRKRLAGVETLLSSTFVTTLTHVANTSIRVMLEVQGSTLSAKAWLASGSAPDGWQATATDTSLTAAGSVGVRSILSATNSNPLPVGVAWDDFASSEAGDDADDFPLNLRLGGVEEITVSANATTPATFVAAGTAAHADNASVTPTLPAGATTGDLLLILAAIRSSGTGLVATPTGYTRLPVFGSTDNVQIFGKVHTGSESNPAVSFTGGSAGDTTSANMIALRGTPTTLTDLTDVVVEAHTLLNGSAQNITVPGVYPSQVPGCVVLYLGWKQDDWTSAATPTGFTEAFESSSTTGSDQAIVLGYVIQTTPACAAETTVTITGGAAAISRGAMVALAAGYQTFTASARSVNGVTKSHAAGTLIEVEDPGVLSL